MRTAVDEDKATRVLREKETVSWAPSSPSRPSLLVGPGSQRCAPHLGVHPALRPGSRGSEARSVSQHTLHPGQSEPRLLSRPSTSELPTLRGSPTLRGASIGRFDGAGFVTPTVAFRAFASARSAGGLGASLDPATGMHPAWWAAWADNEALQATMHLRDAKALQL